MILTSLHLFSWSFSTEIKFIFWALILLFGVVLFKNRELVEEVESLDVADLFIPFCDIRKEHADLIVVKKSPYANTFPILNYNRSA